MSSTDLWQHPPPGGITLTTEQVHVWRVPLEVPTGGLRGLQQLLSAEEVERAERFYFEADRRRWIVARGVLRALLGHYVESDPSQIQFGYNAYGKPALVGPARGTSVCFNLSHSGELAVYAFTLERQIGIDVEHMRANIDHQEMARRCFSPYERAVLQGLPLEEQREAFYRCWTRKEAYIKAMGRGLSMPLDQFDVSLAPGMPTALLTSREDPQAVNRWSLRELPPEADYVGAVAVEGTNWCLSCWRWPGS